MERFFSGCLILSGLTCMLLLLFFYPSMAQVPGCRIRHFDNLNGLPVNSISGLSFDKDHFLWVGTQAGLLRFNGNAFNQVKPGVFYGRIGSILKTYSGGIVVFDDKWTSLIADGFLYTLHDSINNKIPTMELLATTLLYNLYNKEKDKDRKILTSLIKSNNLCWSSNKKLTFLNTETTNSAIITPDSIIITHFINPLQYGFINNTFLAVAQNQQIISYTQKGWNNKIKSIDADGVAVNLTDFTRHSVWAQASGKLFAIYNGTFYKLSIKGHKLLLKPIMTGVPKYNNLSYAKYDEAAGVLAIGTGTNGLYLLEPAIARTMLVQDNDPTDLKYNGKDNLASLLWTANGKLLASNGLVYQKPIHKWTNPDDINGYFLYQDTYHHIWFSKPSNGLNILNRDFTPIGMFNVGIGTSGLVQTNKSTYWLLGSNTITRIKYHSQAFKVDFVRNLSLFGEARNLKSLNDSVFLLSTSSGLYKYHHLSDRLFFIKSGKNHTYRTVVKSPRGNVYVTTYGNGYYLYRNDSLIAMPTDNNRYLNHAHTLVFDSVGYAWVTTNNGLFQVKEDDLLAFANRKTDEVYLQYYDASYGFVTNEFNGGGAQSGLMAPNGNIYLASYRGLVIINPQQVKPLSPKYPIYIQEVSVDGKKINNQNHLSLDKGFKNLKIKINVLNYGHENNLNISYRINGFYQKWTRLDNNFQINVQSLKGGDYELEFRKLNGFGVNNYSYTRIQLNVARYYYETPVFYAGLAFFTVFGFYFYLRYRTYKLNRTKNHLEAEVQRQTIALRENLLQLNNSNAELVAKTNLLNSVYISVTHDLVSPLRFLHRSASKMGNHLGKMTDTELQVYLESIEQTASQAENFVGDLLHWIKVQQKIGTLTWEWTTPNEVVEKNMQLYLWIAMERGIDLRHDPPYNATAVKLPVELVNILIRNLLDNALKYTEKGFISLQATTDGESLIIYVEDSGIGMTPDHVEQINKGTFLQTTTLVLHMGMKIIFDMLEMVNGQMVVNSSLGKGTKIYLRIPLNAQIA